MSEARFDLDSIGIVQKPFPHFTASAVLSDETIAEIAHWFQQTNFWQLVETDFYEQYEFSLLQVELPEHLKFLVSEKVLRHVEQKYINEFSTNELKLVDIVAHKLLNEQHIGIHNDFIGDEETHRMVLHVNPLWREDNGGLLMLFNSADSKDLAKIIKPINNSIFGFEISQYSHHAVSKIYDYTRFTIVYTFQQSLS